MIMNTDVFNMELSYSVYFQITFQYLCTRLRVAELQKQKVAFNTN